MSYTLTQPAYLPLCLKNPYHYLWYHHKLNQTQSHNIFIIFALLNLYNGYI